jgi:hypothetical protein
LCKRLDRDIFAKGVPKVDDQDKMSGATEMQKHPNDLRPKRVGGHEVNSPSFHQVAEVNDQALWRGWFSLKPKKGLLTSQEPMI